MTEICIYIWIVKLWTAHVNVLDTNFGGIRGRVVANNFGDIRGRVVANILGV